MPLGPPCPRGRCKQGWEKASCPSRVFRALYRAALVSISPPLMGSILAYFLRHAPATSTALSSFSTPCSCTCFRPAATRAKDSYIRAPKGSPFQVGP